MNFTITRVTLESQMLELIVAKERPDLNLKRDKFLLDSVKKIQQKQSVLCIFRW